MMNASEEKDYGIEECQATSELPENKLRHKFRLGDITWVKHSGSSWWPAQVIDESCVGGKSKKKATHDCLVRLYGTCQYLYVDPWMSYNEFKMMLKQENKSSMEVFREVLEKELSRLNSSSDYDVESVKSKGGDTEVTTVKASSRKVRKREGLEQCSYRGATGVTVQDRKHGRMRQSCSTHDKEQATDKASSEYSAEGLRDKRQKKQVSHVLDKEGCKIGGSVIRREGSRRSSRSNAKEYLDAAEDRTASLTDTRASEDSMSDGIQASHGEIKAPVRDILFKDIIEEHDAEMAFVDELINGICNATGDNMIGGATASTNGGHSKGELAQATEDTTQVTSLETMNHTTKNDSSLNEIIDTPGCSSHEGTGAT